MAELGQRHDIEDKIREITNRIIRGKRARDNPAIRFYRLGAYVKTISAAVTGIGIGNPFLAMLGGDAPAPTIASVADSFRGLPLWVFVSGVGVYVVLVIVQKLIATGDLEKKAAQALTLYETMRRIDLQLRQRLSVPDPMTQLSQLHDNVIAMEDNNSEVMPDYDEYSDEANATSSSIIKYFCHHWDCDAPVSGRRG